MSKTVIDALRGTPLFATLSEPALERLATATRERTVKRGDYVFHEGEPGDEFFFVIKGRVRISRQVPGMGEEALAILGPGHYFGEMALVEDAPRSADAIAHETVTLLALGKTELDDLLFIDRDAAYDVLWAFVRTLSSRLRETSNKLTFLTISSKFG
jgi:CRP/FNR family transcriptional regulator, cyclic AMP receptor protein